MHANGACASMNETSSLLDIRDIAKNFGSVVALRAAALNVRAGEVHALMGANGAGKSTLVKILTGVFPADAGEIILDGKTRSFRSPAEARAGGHRLGLPGSGARSRSDGRAKPAARQGSAERDGALARRARRRRSRSQGFHPRHSLSDPASHRSCARAGFGTEAPSSRRDHRRAIGGSGGKSLRHGSSPPRAGPFGHIHFAPHGRGLGHMRPGDGPARRNHRRRHRYGAGQPGAHRHVDVRGRKSPRRFQRRRARHMRAYPRASRPRWR